MASRARFRVIPVVLAAAVALGAAACGSSGGDSEGAATSGTLSQVDLSGASFKVGSKEFTEQIVLGEIAVQALQAAGAKVDDLATITGSTNVRTALTSGEIDMYWEYTGTAWSTHFKHETADAPTDSQALFDLVKKEDAGNGISWLNAAPLDNTYALAVSAENAAKYNLKSLSDYAALANKDPGSAKLCAAAEFLTRDDGWNGLEKAYGFDLPDSGVAELELSLVPGETKKGDTCLLGEVTATDGAVSANNLVILADDKNFFPRYNAAVTVRTEVLEANPDLPKVFDPISKLLTTETMRGLNERVDVDGEDPADVAADFLAKNGFTA